MSRRRSDAHPVVVCDLNVRCAAVTPADFTAASARLHDQCIPVHFGPDTQG
ncbi:hypothetical protein ACIBAG_42570 [Streptomyces sp. NPDC051243]|uniref:hypothetical protein n=1 Tax=Streptomyces sp. NPDC051243 TaxID=3365646 RepID=UPI003798F0E6